MKLLRGVIAVTVGAAIAAAALAGGVDWSKAKRIPDEGVQWGVIPLDGGKVDAFYGRPESDYVVVRVACPSPRALMFSYIDSTMAPQAKYRVRLRTGKHEFTIDGATGERWEMDDLVELKFGPTSARQLYDDLKGGAELALVIEQVSGPWSTGVAMPGDAKGLAPFFAACGK